MPQRRRLRSHLPGAAARRGWGTLPGRLGVLIVAGGASLGMLVCLLAGSDPGSVLGVPVVVATAAAVFAVEPAAVYVIIPVPALAYTAAALITGVVHDRADVASAMGAAVGGAQWIATGFLAMTAATVLAAAVTVARWPRGRAPGKDGPAGTGRGGHSRQRQLPGERRPSHRHRATGNPPGSDPGCSFAG